MISTVIDQSLGLEFPIFQGGMAWVADASLAAGVSNAGGLGLIAAMNSNGEQLREEISKKLPNYMMPNSIEKLSSMPMNLNGKIDRTTLKQIYS